MNRALPMLLATAMAHAASTTVALDTVGEPASAPDRVATLRFDLTPIPAAAVISSARLMLVFDAPANQPYDSKFSVCDAGQGARDCSEPIRIQGPGAATSDLTALVRTAFSIRRKTIDLAVFSSPNSYASASIQNRAADASARPKLEVTFDATAPKAVTNHPFLNEKFGPVTLDGSASAKPDESKTGLLYRWTVDQPAPASTYSPGQELGQAARIQFQPDVPGMWMVRLRVTDAATKEFSEDTVAVTDINLRPHPRLGLDEGLLGQIDALKTSKRPVWARFEAWLNKPGETAFGSEGQGLLLGFVTTKNKQYLNAAWKIYAPSIYANARDRSQGLRPFFGACPAAVYCDDHAAASRGGFLIMEIAVLYDWGFAGLEAAQRQDLTDWLNAANRYLFEENINTHTHFRNDGVMITLGIAASAYATYGENRQAMTQMAWFRQEWAHTLEALDIVGRGGALGEGNAYGEVTGGQLIDIANLVYYASGENLFYSHPYFRRHLAYEAFSTYPNRLSEGDDPIGHSDPPQPFPEGAALGGDDVHGHSWHSLQLRPNGLALARRFPRSEEADIWNWVFRQAEDDRCDDPWADVYFYSPPPPLTKPKRLSLFDPSLGYVYVRQDWNGRDATWISSWAGPHVDLHQHLDQGSFTLFKRRDLAAKTGSYDYNPTTQHFLSYYTRTVSANNILIGDPHEYFSTFIAYWGCDGEKQHTLWAPPDGGAQVCLPNDGGQRTMAPYSLSLFSTEEFLAHRRIYDVAKVVSFADNGKAVAWVADITNAYSSPQHTAPLNKPKVTKVYRRFVYLREPDVLLIADTVESTDATFEKSWLIHAVDRLEAGGAVQEIDRGESIHTGTNRARIVVDDKSPSSKDEVTADLRAGYAALQIETLFPADFQYRVIGGREAAKTSHQGQFQTDPKVLQGGGTGNHMHRHFKDFWVKDYSEGVQPDHRSLNWAPVFPQETNASLVAPTFIGGYGRWRLEIQPTTPAKNDYFLNVLKPTLEAKDSMPELTRFETGETFGAAFNSGGKSYRVTFPKETLDAPAIDGMDLQAPAISHAQPANPLPAGTRQTVVSVNTNEAAVCRYSYISGIMFPYMTGAFTTSDGLVHSLVSQDLRGGDTYTYFIRCQDKSGNENLEDLRLSFSVAQ